jgi:hypothetical protein
MNASSLYDIYIVHIFVPTLGLSYHVVVIVRYKYDLVGSSHHTSRLRSPKYRPTTPREGKYVGA